MAACSSRSVDGCFQGSVKSSQVKESVTPLLPRKRSIGLDRFNVPAMWYHPVRLKHSQISGFPSHCERSEAISIALCTAMEIAAHALGLDPKVASSLAMTGNPPFTRLLCAIPPAALSPCASHP